MKRTLICIVLAAVTCLAAVWAAPRTSASVAEWLQAPPGARRQTARRLTAASTLDAGMRFTMAGVICGAPHAAGAVSVRLRTSPDGRSWRPAAQAHRPHSRTCASWRSTPARMATSRK